MASLVLALLRYALLISTCQGRLEELPDEASSRISLSRCLTAAALRYFDKGGILTISMSTHEVAAGRPSTSVLDRIVLKELFAQKRWSVVVKNVSLPHYQGNVERSQYYVFQLRSVDELNRTMEKFCTFRSWNPHARIAVITATLYKNREEVAADLINVLWSYKILNAVVILPKIENETVCEIYTWYPYTDGTCGENFTKIHLLDTCTYAHFTYNTNWYPKKIPRNLNGCKLKVETVIWPPFVMGPVGTDASAKNESLHLVQGLEVQLMNTIARSAGIDIIYSTSDIPEDWGMIYSNGTAEGMMLKLKNREVDMVMGSISPTAIRHRFFDHTIPYYQDSFIWCVRTAKQQHSWKNLLFIFGDVIWFCIFCAFVMISVLIWVLARKQSHESTAYKIASNCTLQVLSMFLGIAVKILPKSFMLRFVVLIWLMISLIITTAYKTDLVSVLTQPSYEHQISTIEEVLGSNYKILCMKDLSMFFDKSENDWYVEQLLKRWTDCDDMDECLDRTVSEENIAVIVPRIRLYYVINKYMNRNGRSQLFCSRDSIVTFPVEMLMAKGHPLNERINGLLVQILSAGFLEKWTIDIRDSIYMNISAILIEDEEKSLHMSHLSGVFFGLLIGLITATVTFFMELYAAFRFFKQHRI